MPTIPSVIDRFRNRAVEQPDSTAVVDRGRTISYRQLDRDSDLVAARLARRGIGPGSLVPLICDRSASLVVGLLGIAKSGAAYVPIDDGYPDARKRYIVVQTRSSLALCSRGAWASDTLEVLDVDELAAPADPSTPPVAAGTGDIAYVIFTSGTTGQPKGVVIEHAALANLIDWHNREFEVNGDSRLTSMAKIGFDVAQWEVWSALCAGATLHLLEPAVRVDPAALARFYANHAISHAFVPTVMVPEVVAATRGVSTRLRYLFTAGEKLNPIDLDAADYALVDYYGPTEATIFATSRRVPSASAGAPYSIGKPVAGATAYILDPSLGPVPPGEAGELCLGGPGLARGYLDNDALTRERFVNVGGQRLYRTGDLARLLPDGQIQFLGRGDEQIKIRGNRVELGEIEAQLQLLPGVRKAAVAVAAPDDPGRKQIVAFVVAHAPAEARQDGFRAELRQRLGAVLPDYMIPAAFVSVDEFPLTPNGKIDKAELLRGYAHTAPAASAPAPAAETRAQALVAEVFARVLEHRDFGLDDSYFALGGQSLLAAQLTREAGQALGTKAYVRDIYEFPSVRALAAALERRAGRAAPTIDAEPILALQSDIRLPEGADFGAGYEPSQIVAPRHVLLTGATGFVGAHLLCDLLSATQATIHCPIRTSDQASAGERLRSTLAKYALAPDPSALLRVRAYAADLAEPRLGLAELDHAYLAESVDLVYHCASAVNFIQPYSHLRRDNVQGLGEVLAFCAAGRLKPLALMSTISVYSWGHRYTGKRVMREDDDIDQNLTAVSADIGYVRSKWVMEKIADMAANRGLPLMTFRLGYATFHGRSGRCADYQWWSRLVRTCIAYGGVPDLRNFREGLTSVDYMTRAIAHISRNPAAIGKKFNLVNRDRNNLTLHEFFAKLEAASGLRLPQLPYRDWCALWENDHTAPLYPLLSLFKDVVRDGQSTAELYQDGYRWDCGNVDEFLRGSGIAEPAFDEPQLRRYLRRSIGLRLPAGTTSSAR